MTSALPKNNAELLDDYIKAVENPIQEPSKTFRIDFNRYRIGNMTDNIEALKQMIRKAILTPRSRYRIYDDTYGCEIWELIGADVTDAFIDAEIPRMLREAIVYDDRVNDAYNFVITRKGDGVYVTFDVDSIYGEFRTEVTI